MSIRRAQDERIEGTPDGLNAISEIMDVPDAPTIGTAVDNGNLGASVTFTAAVTGGTPASYTVTSTPGSITGTGSSSPVTVSGLTAGTAYTFKVKAVNAAGTFGPESSASNSVTPLFPVVGAYDSLASVTLSSTTLSVTFAGIPTGYKHLQLRGIARTTRASTQDALVMQFNSDTGSNYSRHQLNGDATGTPTATADAGTSATGMQINRFTAASATANNFGTLVVDILDYLNTNKYKTVKTLGGYDDNGTGFISLNSGLWMNTSAVTSITLTSLNAASFATYSSFALYGVK